MDFGNKNDQELEIKYVGHDLQTRKQTLFDCGNF